MFFLDLCSKTQNTFHVNFLPPSYRARLNLFSTIFFVNGIKITSFALDEYATGIKYYQIITFAYPYSKRYIQTIDSNNTSRRLNLK